ncbi:MAG: helix-turn-helix transcriptional regulator [bacterium]|nr:helix-turn-helix transcriptional regulator [bacterium]
MPKKAEGSVARASHADADEYQCLCVRIAALEGHRSQDVVCALDMELYWQPDLSIRRMGIITPVSETAISRWIKGRSSPTWELICAVARGLHPRDPMGDPLAWLEAGREHLGSLVDRRDELVREHGAEALDAAVREALNCTATADAMLGVVREFPPSVLGELIELISSVMARAEGAEETEEESK